MHVQFENLCNKKDQNPYKKSKKEKKIFGFFRFYIKKSKQKFQIEKINMQKKVENNI